MLALHNAGAAPVVNDHVSSAGRAFPARSLTRGSAAPPLTVAVYVVNPASCTAGSKLFAGSGSRNIFVLMAAGSIASLKEAVTLAARTTPAAPASGETNVT